MLLQSPHAGWIELQWVQLLILPERLISALTGNMHTIERLDHDKIKANLHTKRIGSQIIVFNSTSSTNDIAWEYARNDNNDGLVIFAEHQTVGRGRGSNKWLSDFGDSLLFSIILNRIKINSEMLSLAAAVSIAGSIAENTAIKWPNDILLNGKKIAGILIESRNHKFVVGVGINCHQKQFPDEIKDTATSVDIQNGGICDRNIIAKRVLSDFEHWLQISEKNSQKVVDKMETSKHTDASEGLCNV